MIQRMHCEGLLSGPKHQRLFKQMYMFVNIF